jgi:hypothetical protein
MPMHTLTPFPPTPLYPPAPYAIAPNRSSMPSHIYPPYPQATDGSVASNVEQPDPHTNPGLMFGCSGS